MSDSEDKQHDPSQRRIEEARRKGDIPRSAELISAAGWLGVLLAVLLSGEGIVAKIGSTGMMFVGQADRLAPEFLHGPRPPAGSVLPIITAVLPLFLLPVALAFLAILAQRAVVFSPQRLAPDWNRVSPLANARQKFGREGLVNFLKAVAKMLGVATALWLFLAGDATRLVASSALSPGQSAALLAQIMTGFLALICAIAVVFGGFDYFWQRQQYLRRNRMSRQELADEMKESEGDPHQRAHRRQRARDIATNRMLRDVAGADVVVVNPTHYAVALKWDRSKRAAPVCVAKGVDEIAARIRERAAEAGVPLHPDPPTARAIHASVEIGGQIRPEHYLAIAAAIRFADKIRKHGRKSAP
ncbi:MAG: flagellar type III secretion system protein FlhB [Paracoccaceae bacterium]